MDSQLRRRADELRLTDADIAAWEVVVDDALVDAVLGAVITYEDALVELAM
ncbi:MAG: hypothetical protein JOY80_08465 [Candidatus Dormibacteraeota bacterium]|nr:hypothetical protein [Candidatus Dormibacteraeota bacterium]